MGFGDIFTSGVYADPYAGASFNRAQEQTRNTRLDVARAFTDWRKSNPEAGLADVRDFLSMATGGDLTLAPSSMQGISFQKRLEEQAAAAKAKRLRDEQEQQLIEDQKWSQVIEQTFEKKLAENAWNPDAAWTQTQAQIAGNVTDPELKKQFTKRLANFDPKGHARALSDEFISKNLGAMQQVARDAYLRGLDDKDVMGVLNDYTKRPLDPSDQTLAQVLGVGKRAAQQEKAAEARRKADEDWQEQQRKEALEKRDQADADAIASMRSAGVPEEVIIQRFPRANELKDKVRASQLTLWQVGQQTAMAKAAETSEAMRKQQAEEMQLDENAKALAGGKTGNPMAAVVLRQVAGSYALSGPQRSALIGALTSKEAKGKSQDELMKLAQRAIGQTIAFDDVARAKIDDTFARQKPLSFGEALAGVEKARQAEIDKVRSAIQQAGQSGRDEESLAIYQAVEADLVADIQGGELDQLYNGAKPSLYGEYVDPAAVSSAVTRRKQEARQLLDQVRAAKQRLIEKDKARKPPTKPRASTPAVPTTMRNDWR